MTLLPVEQKGSAYVFSKEFRPAPDRAARLFAASESESL